MPFFLRKIRKSKWYRHNDVPWLAEGELQADALRDLLTSSNQLSVWHIEDDRSNLERTIAALAANVTDNSNFDYALFDQQIVYEIGIKVESKKTKGASPDEEVNSWHCDLIELSASKLRELAKAIQTKAEIERIQVQDVIQLVAESISSGRIDRTKVKLKSEAIEKIDRVIASKSRNN
ncbi:MAG: hypothetical protein ACM3SR_04500 [Ignavibacteriales bacterium]